MSEQKIFVSFTVPQYEKLLSVLETAASNASTVGYDRNCTKADQIETDQELKDIDDMVAVLKNQIAWRTDWNVLS